MPPLSMRSRPDLKLYLFPGTVEAGNRFRAEAELDPAARALLEGLRAQSQSLVISGDAVVATLPAPLVDPASIEPLLIGLARLARLLGGGAARGPYR